MSELPKPAFTSGEEIEAGMDAITDTGDTTLDKIGGAVSLGELILDNEISNILYHIKDGTLLYHIFRGEEVPEKYWGRGEYGLVVLSIAESHWVMDKPKVEFHPDVCRQEVLGDNPTEMPKYPAHFYGAYLVSVPGVDRKLSISEDKICHMGYALVDELRKSIAGWSNGS